MANKLKKNDKVSWKFGRGLAHGKIKDIITADTEIAGLTIRASKDDPKALIETVTGKTAAHNLEKLTKETA